MKYRSEIDGLRAVAVVPVILFHAGFPAFGGGFVGVDVFFVISGYLITTSILSEMAQGTFSLVHFYERRARRILPALFFVLLVSLPFAWLWLFPAELKDFSRSLVAVSIYYSNILFWREAGYWDTASELKPLLHSWSLAVEEQYYLLFPLFLILMWRFKKNWIFGSFLLIAGVSFGAAQWGAYNKPAAAFYLLPTRAWELAIGAGIAFYLLHKKPSVQIQPLRKLTHEALGLLGLLMIGYSIFAFSERTPLPSAYTLLPTIGTGLIILFAPVHTVAARLLSLKPLVAIGLISYSAYLWHQPILAFARHRMLTEPSRGVYMMLALLSFPLAYLSWRFVEKPFRTKGLFTRKAIFTYSLISTLFFVALGLAGQFTNAVPGLQMGSHFAERQMTGTLIEEKIRANRGLGKTCDKASAWVLDCMTNEEPEILIWGDSFAMHLVPGILSSNPDAKIVQMTKSACGPIFDVAPINEPTFPLSWGAGCLEFTQEVRTWLRENETVKYAVLSSVFSQYFSTETRLLHRSGDISAGTIAQTSREFEKTLSELNEMGITPIIFSPPPTNEVDLGRCLAKAEWRGIDFEACSFDDDDLSEARQNAYTFLANIDADISLVRLDELICTDARCLPYQDAHYIYRDAGHLSHEGSAYLGKKHGFYSIITAQ